MNTLTVSNNSKYQTLLCESYDDLVAAGKLRYASYRDVSAIAPNKEELFLDDYDSEPNSRTCILRAAHIIVATIRASLYTPQQQHLQIPAMEVYQNEIRESISLDKTIIESNRFVVHSETKDSGTIFRQLFQFIFLNVHKVNADYVITAVRPEHARFYSKFMMHPISAAKKYPSINVEMVLLAADCKKDLKGFTDTNPEYSFSTSVIDNYPSW